MSAAPAGARRGFTLIEILTVFGIVAVLVAIAVPAYQRVTESGHATACVSHLRQLGAALNSYLGENNMEMPTLKAGRKALDEEVPVIDNTLDKYVTDKSLFACPADRKWASATGTSYYWNVALNAQSLASLNFLKFVEDRSKIPLLSDKEGFHPYLDNKVNVLYADGHATKDLKFFTE